MAQGAHAAIASMRDLQRELKDAGLQGYESDTEFNAGFVEEPFKKELDAVLVVENLPRVPADKLSKLTDYVTKIFSSVVSAGAPAGAGAAASAVAVTMPLSASAGTTEGFALIEFGSREDAEKALAATNGYDFDARHKLRVYAYEAAREVLAEPEDGAWAPPRPCELKEGADLYHWLYDEAGRDEFSLAWLDAGERAHHEVFFSDAKRAPQLEFAGDADAMSYAGKAWAFAHAMRWSPKGTFLATLSARGVRLWSGSKYLYGHGFEHVGVNEVVFSPSEANIITWNGHEGNATPERAAIVWDARTGVQKRAFKQRRREDESCDLAWSACGKFLARLEYDWGSLKTELLRVYEAPSIALLDGRSTKVPGAVEISWCPAPGTPVLAWWAPERENAPASVQLLRFPAREVVRQRNLFNVETLQLVWHPDGAFLAVLAARLPKKRLKGADKAGPQQPLAPPPGNAFTGSAGWTIELFRLRDKEVPVTVLEVAEHVRGLSWEPAGARFALITDSTALVNTYNITFYRMADAPSKPPEKLFVLENKPHNSVAWSPRGELALLCGVGAALSGRYEFFDVERRKTYATAEHANASGAAWDPSGRAVASFKAAKPDAHLTRELIDNGYQLYTFQGVKYFETMKPKLRSFEWRPRPASLLTDDEVKSVAKNLKAYIARFQEEDKRAENRKKLLERLLRRKQRDDFRDLVARGRAAWEAARPMREALLGHPDTPIEEVVVEEIYERVLEEKVEAAA